MKSELVMVTFCKCSKEENMDQLHKRFIVEQIKILLQGYCQGKIWGFNTTRCLLASVVPFFAEEVDFDYLY